MKVKIFISFVFILTIAWSLNSFAVRSNSDAVSLNKLNFCKISPKAENNYEPEKFETTNNLLRETGQESLYCGEKIIISGTVVDENCVPISDAKVYIWQVNCKGKYPYRPLRNDSEKNLVDDGEVLTFTGNGVTTTNNKGEFHFITIYPAAAHGLAPHINLRVEHRTIGSLQTRLMLKGHKLEHPEYYPELKAIYQIAAKKSVSIYNYQIVMPGISQDNY